MTREQAKLKIRMSVTVNKDYIKSLEKADEVIDQIYNDHETAIEILMKANEEEISRHFNEVKAKDEEITELNHTVSGLNEMYLEAKDEINALKAQQTVIYDILKSLQKQHLYDVLYRTNQ